MCALDITYIHNERYFSMHGGWGKEGLGIVMRLEKHLKMLQEH